jgi:transglutaminase-like putative cysteine protease
VPNSDSEAARRIRYQVSHETCYRYPLAALSSRHLAHLTPRETPWQDLLEHSIEVSPRPRELSTGVDYFGNAVTRFFVDEAHDALTVRAESVVEVRSSQPQGEAAAVSWESATQPLTRGDAGCRLEVEQFRLASPLAPLLDECAAYASESLVPERPWLEALVELACRIRRDFKYDPTATTVTTPVVEVLDRRAGVCQDFAHLMISCLRSVGMAARYISGYVLTVPPEGGERLTGADASHAWVAAHHPQLGWLAFDPTNGKLADTEFVTLGWGRDFADVTPLRGVVLGPEKQGLRVCVSVTPLAVQAA